jgi:hypothetical protein
MGSGRKRNGSGRQNFVPEGLEKNGADRRTTKRKRGRSVSGISRLRFSRDVSRIDRREFAKKSR